MSWALAIQLPPFPGHSDGVKEGLCDPAKTGTHKGTLAGAPEAAWPWTPSFLS